MLWPRRSSVASTELERERRLLVREPELSGFRPDLDDLGGRHAGADARDRRIR